MRAIFLAAVAAAALSGCGGDDKEALPGKRISVLRHQQALVPDSGAGTAPIQLPPAASNPDWPQEGGPLGQGLYHLRLTESFREAWSASIGASVASDTPRMPQPVVAAGRVFTMDARHQVRAFEAGSGKELWKVDLADGRDDDAVAGGLAFDAGRIFATTGFAKVIALDAAGGKELWRRTLTGPLHGPPAVDDGRVFVISINNTLHGLNASDGRELWPAHQAAVEAAGLLGTAAPAAAGDTLIGVFTSGEIVAVRPATGRVIWSDSLASTRRTDELASLAHIRGHPVLDRGRLFVASYAGVLAAINARTGERLWDREVGSLFGSWLAGDYLFVISSNQELICLARDNGAILWISQLPAFENEKEKSDPILWAGPVLAGGRLIVIGSTGKGLSLSPADGKVISTFPLVSGTSNPPVVADGRLFVVGDDGRLTAYQ
jgi:outer membrane protein assembly factor BamB